MSSQLQRLLQLRVLKWGGRVNFSYLESQRDAANDGRTPATAFSVHGGRLDIPDITMETLDEVEGKLFRHARGQLTPEASLQTSEEIHMYVCTHGARDCRCGDTGGAVVRALKDELSRRMTANPKDPAGRIKIGEVGHVGQHQFAANVLIYPHGDWLGLVKPGDISELVSCVANLEHFSKNFCFSSRPPLLLQHWRGRMGLEKAEQLALFTRYS